MGSGLLICQAQPDKPDKPDKPNKPDKQPVIYKDVRKCPDQNRVVRKEV